MPKRKTPHLMIIGAPNVGKSTLFNRLVGHRKAVVSKEPGVTRDLLFGTFKLNDSVMTLIDSGGLLLDVSEPIPQAIQSKILHAMSSCSLILFLVDVRTGVTPLDEEIAIFLKKSGQKVLLCINKVDTFSLHDHIYPFYSLGFEDSIAISAEHGLGIDDLFDKIQLAVLPSDEFAEIDEPAMEIKVIIMGKQNVGKSSLLNALTRSDRMIVTEIPGTTIDSVDTLLERGQQRYRLIDTAGIRKKKRARGKVENIGVMKTKQNLKRSDIALLVLDSQENLSVQDISIAGHILRSHKPLLLAFNKWDLIEDKKETSKNFRQEIEENFKFLKSSPIVFVSALERINLKKIFPAIEILYEKFTKKFSTSELNQGLSKIVKQHGSFYSSTSPLHLRYITQIGVRPQHFLIFAKNAKSIRLSLRRFLESSIKNNFDLQGIPIRLSFRESQRVFLKRKNK